MKSKDQINDKLDICFDELDHISNITYQTPLVLKGFIEGLKWVLGEEE